VKWSLTPRTYVFSYSSQLTQKALCNGIDKWYTAKHGHENPELTFLPRIVATPKTIAILSDDCLTVDPGHETNADAQEAFGKDARCVMGIWPTNRHFGLFVLHIMRTVTQRLGMMDHASRVHFSLINDLQLVTDSYFSEMKGKKANYIYWTGASNS